jgi:hypothetical protein
MLKIQGRNISSQIGNQLPFASYVHVGQTQPIFNTIWHKRWKHFSKFSNQDVRHAVLYIPQNTLWHTWPFIHKFELKQTSYRCLAIIYGKWRAFSEARIIVYLETDAMMTDCKSAYMLILKNFLEVRHPRCVVE